MKRDFPGSSAGKESTCNAGDQLSIPGLGRSLQDGMATLVFLLGESHGQRSLSGYLHGVAKSQTRLRTKHSTANEKTIQLDSKRQYYCMFYIVTIPHKDVNIQTAKE